LDQPLTFHVVHPQRQPAWAEIHDLAGFAVETLRLVIVFADNHAIAQAEHAFPGNPYFGLACRGRVQPFLQCRIQRHHTDWRRVLRRDDLCSQADRAFDKQPLRMHTAILAG